MELQRNSESGPFAFSAPLLLISTAFFSLYLFALAEFLTNLIPGFSSLSFLVMQVTHIYYAFNGLFFFNILIVAALYASVTLVRELKKRAESRQAGLPLCIALGIIAVSLVLFTFSDPADPVRKYLGIAVVSGFIGYGLLPAGAAYFLMYWDNPLNTASRGIRTAVAALGIVGMLCTTCLVCIMITATPSGTPQHYDVFQFDTSTLFFLIGSLIYGAFLLPFIGVVFIRTGLACRTAETEIQKKPVTPP